MSSSTATSPLPTASEAPSNENNTNNHSNSTLLFFVALGFGIVFTNLWIIVGVKYCFRYKQRVRARAAAAAAAGMSPASQVAADVDLGNMPRPRRRREKKLMTLAEVNERFPATQYKTWREAQSAKGLPREVTVGAVLRTSRRNSLDDVPLDGDDPKTVAPDANTSADIAMIAAAAHDEKLPYRIPATSSRRMSEDPILSVEDYEKPMAIERYATNTPSIMPPSNPTERSHDRACQDKATDAESKYEDDDDPVIRATGPSLDISSKPGDTCAICIDSIDDQELVRGLTCGHAFHSVCVDPWLTSRRACCPLCKADYFMPKPKSTPESCDTHAPAHVTYPALVQLGLISMPRSGSQDDSRPRRILSILGFPRASQWMAGRRQGAQQTVEQSAARPARPSTAAPPTMTTVSPPRPVHHATTPRMSFLANPFRSSPRVSARQVDLEAGRTDT